MKKNKRYKSILEMVKALASKKFYNDFKKLISKKQTSTIKYDEDRVITIDHKTKTAFMHQPGQ